MNTPITIEVEGRPIVFRLDQKFQRWHSLEEPKEAAFPLITIVDGERLELYSDGDFAEVEK